MAKVLATLRKRNACIFEQVKVALVEMPNALCLENLLLRPQIIPTSFFHLYVWSSSFARLHLLNGEPLYRGRHWAWRRFQWERIGKNEQPTASASRVCCQSDDSAVACNWSWHHIHWSQKTILQREYIWLCRSFPIINAISFTAEHFHTEASGAGGTQQAHFAQQS